MGRTSRPCRNLAALSLLLAVALAGCGGWTRKDTLAELGFATMTTVDWVQTNSIVTVCEEENSIIGACGENMSPDVYFPMALALHAAIAATLPPRWRLAWQAIATGAELNQVWNNAANGFGLDGSIPPLPVGYSYRHPGDP
jgi:hypothetical protein